MPAKLAGYLKGDKEALAKLHVSGQTSPAAAAALIFFCLLFFYQEKKRRDHLCEKEGPYAKLQETIMRSKKVPGKLLRSRFGGGLDARDESSSFSFSCLDARKGGKRKLRRQGHLPSWPGASNATKRVTPSCKRQSCARKKYPANCSTLDLGLFLDAGDESSSFFFSFLDAKNGTISFSFSFLDERKGGKRKSRHRGCLPS